MQITVRRRGAGGDVTVNLDAGGSHKYTWMSGETPGGGGISGEIVAKALDLFLAAGSSDGASIDYFVTISAS